MTAAILTGVFLLGFAALAGKLLMRLDRQLAPNPAACQGALRMRRNGRRAAAGGGH